MEDAVAAATPAQGTRPLEGVKPATPQFHASETLTDRGDATSYNNFYELGLDKEDPAKNASSLETEPWSIVVEGEVREDKRSPIGFELGVKDVRVVSEAQEYPITPKEHGTAFLMDHRHLWLRSSKQHAVLRVRSAVVNAVRDFFDGRGFTLLDTPILTPAACEGTSTLFETPYFDTKAYLAQSGQLYAEAGAMAFGKAYCFGPTFRAEKSKTRRHLTEFWMVEPEVAFMDLDGDMDLAEDLVRHVVTTVVKRCETELKTLERDTSKLEAVKDPFPRITYEEAVEILKKKGFPAKFGDDFGGDEETALAPESGQPVLIHRYPAAIKAFYMKRDPEDDRLALGVDMIAPEGYGEIIGGSQREEDYDTLLSRIEEHKLPKDAFEWYLDLRRYGSVPHSGFGMGIERVVAWICGIKHVRETIPFPRTMTRLYP